MVHVCSGAIAQRPARLWRDGQWQNISEAVSPEEQVRVLYAGGECRLQVWSGNPEHADWRKDLEDLCLGHVLLDRQHLGPESGPSPVCQTGSARFVVEEPGNRTVRVTLNPATTFSGSDEPGNIGPEALLHHMETFLALPGTCPELWESTGCFHRAAMLDARTGRFVHLAEDIGRHNCVDRLAGWACRNALLPGAFILFLSARITGSLYAKARRAGFCFLVSRAAVTTAPLKGCDSADVPECGCPVTIVGFCRPREGRLTVFTDARGRVVSC